MMASPETSRLESARLLHTVLWRSEIECVCTGGSAARSRGGKMFGAPMSEEAAERASARVLLMYRQGSLNLPDALKDIYLTQHCATKPCSVSKMREMSSSGIFTANSENGESETDSSPSNPDNKIALLMYQQVVSAISQISFGSEESLTPKKPTTLTEVAKQRELGGTLEGETEAEIKNLNALALATNIGPSKRGHCL